MNEQLRGPVRQRAGDRCEYCRMPQSGTVLPHEVDHIRSQKHGGPSMPENLCWACAWCNSFKGSDIAAHPPGSDDIVPLYNPRAEAWVDHFFWGGSDPSRQNTCRIRNDRIAADQSAGAS